jgi:hypothetical protein
MLQPGWVLERYHGWSVLVENGRLKLLGRRRGPIRTFLLLTRGAEAGEIAGAAQGHGLLRPFSIAVLRDFSDFTDARSRLVGAETFRRVDQGRWFGAGTFVVDLAADQDALWARVPARERTKARQAAGAGTRVEFEREPTPAAWASFHRLHVRLARQHGLEKARAETLQAMARAGDLLMARALDGRGRTQVANLVYLHSGQAYFLMGAREREIPAGAGLLTQWETIRALKDLGLAWYDLGLVASADARDGIHRFKKALGGDFVDFGAEYRRVPRGLGTAYQAFRSLRAGLRGRP